MPGTANTMTPNDILAGQIAAKLAEAGLIPRNRQEQLLSKLKAGGVSKDDWNQWIDLATAPQQATENVDE